ncbi:MAG: hypothetical protein ACRCV9_05555, partial [Burkholderiaceae bacterium]
RRQFDPSSYQGFESGLRDLIRSLIGTVAPASPGGSAGGSSGGAGNVGAAVGQGADAIVQSSADLALQIAGVVRDLISATRESIGDVLASIGITGQELVQAMGINIAEMTASSAQQLAAFAASMGVEVQDLAAEVGVQLGTLADRQSLLNDAVEAEIALLPDAQRSKLQPLLDAVEKAADNPEALAIAERNLVDGINKIGGATKDALSPYFDDIDPTDYLADLFSAAGETNTILNNILGAIGALKPNATSGTNSTSTPPPPLSVGASMVTSSGLAHIHQGEMVIDPVAARHFRRYGFAMSQPTTTAQTQPADPAQLDRLVRAVEKMDKNNMMSTGEAARYAAKAAQDAAQRDRRMVMS